MNAEEVDVNDAKKVFEEFETQWCNLQAMFDLSESLKIHIKGLHMMDYMEEADKTLLGVSDEIVEASPVQNKTQRHKKFTLSSNKILL